MRNLKDVNREKFLQIKCNMNELTRENPHFSLLISPVSSKIRPYFCILFPPNSFLKCC